MKLQTGRCMNPHRYFKTCIVHMSAQILALCLVFSQAFANQCHDLFGATLQNQKSVNTFELTTIRELLGSIQKRGPFSFKNISGVQLAILYAKSVAFDLKRQGRESESSEAFSIANQLNEILSYTTDGTENLMSQNKYDLRLRQTNPNARLAERGIATLNQAELIVSIGQAQIPGLILAIDLAKKITVQLVLDGEFELAAMIQTKAIKVDQHLQYLTDGQESRFNSRQ